MHRIKKFLKSWNYYGFDNELELKHQEDVKRVRACTSKIVLVLVKKNDE